MADFSFFNRILQYSDLSIFGEVIIEVKLDVFEELDDSFFPDMQLSVWS